MNSFLSIADATITGLILAVSGPPAPAQSQPVAQPPPQQPTSITVTVQPGDFLDKIAKNHNTNWRRLYDANENVKHPDVIQPGEVLRIPNSDEQIAERPLPATAAPPVSVAPKISAAPAKKSSPPASYPAVSGGSVWDRLAQCESGGNWSINTGNGYYGGLQFSLPTWRSVGGSGYPHQASREEQIARAEILLARSGWGQWPACSSKLGLR